jgi:hypothetical protein
MASQRLAWPVIARRRKTAFSARAKANVAPAELNGCGDFAQVILHERHASRFDRGVGARAAHRDADAAAAIPRAMQWAAKSSMPITKTSTGVQMPRAKQPRVAKTLSFSVLVPRGASIKTHRFA